MRVPYDSIDKLFVVVSPLACSVPIKNMTSQLFGSRQLMRSEDEKRHMKRDRKRLLR
jgi:hypothetical protein